MAKQSDKGTTDLVVQASDFPTAEEIPPAFVVKVHTFLDRLYIEHSEVSERLSALNEFIDSQPYTQVEQEERERLKGQQIAMTHYQGILGARIAYHEARGV